MAKYETPRRLYVERKLAVLKQLGIVPPPQDVIDFCCNPEACTETRCDNIFLDLIANGEMIATDTRRRRRRR